VTPLLVVEGGDGAVADALAELVSAGHEIVQGWSRSPSAEVVCMGRVETPEEAASALLAALGGAGVLVDARAERPVVDRLCEDLRRLGPVDHRPPGFPRRGRLTPQQRALLELLVGGASLGDAAYSLGLSRRTADRRLAEVRTALGVTTTSEAIVAAARRLP
jgi:DNA-binding NarL/FixJ family response regulator